MLQFDLFFLGGGMDKWDKCDGTKVVVSKY
jgi:hypothetical protein